MSSIRSTFIAVLCVASLVACYLGQVSSWPTRETVAEAAKAEPIGSEQLPFGQDGSLFLTPQECKDEHEELRPGALPTCEPTCENPRPICIKMFYVSVDFVPCFCKNGWVRNLATRKCVKLEECPK